MDPFIGFTGAYRDPITHVYPLGNGYRCYCPALMRFNMPDDMSPFGAGGINPYSYCVGDPINQIDPSGHFFEELAKGFSKIFGGESGEPLSLYRKDWVKRVGDGDAVPLSMKVHLDRKALPKGTYVKVWGYWPMDDAKDIPFEDKDVEARGSGGLILRPGHETTLPPVYVDASAQEGEIQANPHLILKSYKGSKKEEMVRMEMKVRLVEPNLEDQGVDSEKYVMAAGVSHIEQIRDAGQRTSIEAQPGGWSGVGPYSADPVEVSIHITRVHWAKRGLKNRLLSCVLGRS